MRLENQQSTMVWRTGGLLMCAIALGLAVATGGAALIPAVLLVALGTYYAGRVQVEAVVLSEHFRTIAVARSRLFSSSTRTFPLGALTARYQAHGGLRSAKYYTLELQYQGETVAALDPKAGYEPDGIASFHAALLAMQAAGAGTVAQTVTPTA